VGPPLAGVQRAAEVFADPDVRAQLRTWHLEQMPLLEMADRLGVADLFEPELRATVAGLSAAEVEIVRQVFLAEIDAAGTATDVAFPVECDASVVAGPVTVRASERDGRPVALVRQVTDD
jgi:hypothetical protein